MEIPIFILLFLKQLKFLIILNSLNFSVASAFNGVRYTTFFPLLRIFSIPINPISVLPLEVGVVTRILLPFITPFDNASSCGGYNESYFNNFKSSSRHSCILIRFNLFQLIYYNIRTSDRLSISTFKGKLVSCFIY